MHAERGWVSRMGLVLLSWILLAACGAPRQEGTGSGSPAPETSIEEIRYRLTGGIAGFDLDLRVASGGELRTVVAGHPVQTGQLTAAEWRELAQFAAAMQKAELESQYGIPGSVVDALNEVVTVTGGGKTISVAVTDDPRDEPPPSFRDLATRLREIALSKQHFRS